ncbi:GNAT family N-acetyltransferase [Massilia cavernae]|uniref:N-acetyltransferase n=1 Tax=Massilia cavernae TaxID=2320864 RepID=A0A418Y744_9BURK|nr:GNAT family N-acetyltransferase [Massilia cavernae]RJG25421.1 N-acetyltransferase [Massilia cavernae]
MANFTSRLAAEADLPALKAVMTASIDALQRGFLSDEQVAASHAIMGLDTQLVKDGTYFVVESEGRIAGCGGWSRRATLYGGDHTSSSRNPALLDPARDAARIRAMYTHPDFVRQGVGKLILSLCEQAAAAEGFTHAQLMGTMSGEALYAASGYRVVERTGADVEGVNVPLVRMEKPLAL